MPASQAPFAIGDAVRFLPDADHVECVIECQWICPDAPAHWRLVTAWTDDRGGQHIRIGDAAEFVPQRLAIAMAQSRSIEHSRTRCLLIG